MREEGRVDDEVGTNLSCETVQEGLIEVEEACSTAAVAGEQLGCKPQLAEESQSGRDHYQKRKYLALKETTICSWRGSRLGRERRCPCWLKQRENALA